MYDPSLRARAIAFAVSAGCLVFILAILGTVASQSAEEAQETLIHGLSAALICGVISWAVTFRAIADIAGSIDRLTARVKAASRGDFSFVPDEIIRRELPELVESIDRLLSRVRLNIDSVEKLAMQDPVTGLPNRLSLRRYAEHVLRSRNASDKPGAMLFIDLDRFKTVNDTLGHALGDQVLNQVAERLQAVAEPSQGVEASATSKPLVARLSGDEFTILAPSLKRPEDASKLAHRVLRALSTPFEIGEHKIEIGASIGIAIFPDDGEDLTALMKNADLAMYHAKAAGRGQVQYFSERLKAENDERLALERQLRDALEQDQFELYLQPQISVRDMQSAAAEALIRWHHPELGLRAPKSFISVAEECGLIVDIGDWTINAVAETLSRWRNQGCTHRIGLNVSARQLERPDFFGRIDQAMRAFGAPWDQLELEITESLIMKAETHIIGRLQALRECGVTVSIDDFGTGYSNLARLRQLPIDRLKVDRSLIADIVVSAEARTIVHAIVALAHGLGYDVVAQGVESQVQGDILTAMGCDILQGFGIATPMDEPAFHAWVAGRQPPPGNRRSMIDR